MNSVDSQRIRDAVDRLQAGDVLAFPTETVYGLGANARDDDAVSRVFSLKGRPANHPLIVHVANQEAAGQWASAIPASARVLMARFWPGPLTLVLPARDEVSRLVTGGQDSVALRVPRHPVAKALLAAFGGGLAAPSANPFGRISPTDAGHVRGYFPGLTVLDGGPCSYGLESTIVSLTDGRPRILRPGALPLATLRQALDGMAIETADASDPSPRVPGSLPAHYAPDTPLEIVPFDQMRIRATTLSAQGVRVAVLRHHRGPRQASLPLPQFLMPAAPVAYGRRLYARLHELDEIGFDRLLVEAPPRDEAWYAVNDRLARAAQAHSNGVES